MQLSAGLRRQVPRAPAAFPDRGAEPALRAARPGALRRPRSARRRSAQARLLRPPRRASPPRGAPTSTAPRSRALVAEIFPAAPSAGEVKHLHAYAAAFVRAQRRQARPADRAARRPRSISTPARAISTNCWRRSIRRDWHPDARREVLVNYLGFPFWDVLTFPVTSGREIGELNEILVDRISPQDAHALRGFDGIESLQGHRLRPFRGVLLARLSRERLSARPPARARPADRHRLRFGRRRCAQGPDRHHGAEEARLHPDPRRRGSASRPQQGPDRGAAQRRRRDGKRRRRLTASRSKRALVIPGRSAGASPEPSHPGEAAGMQYWGYLFRIAPLSRAQSN